MKRNSKFLAFLICSLMMPGHLISQAPRDLTIAQVLQEGLPTKDMFSKGGKVFTLSNVGITDLAGIEQIPNIGNAWVVGLDHNNVEVLKANTFNYPQFKDLSGLDLSKNKMSSIEPGGFTGLENLQFLWLNGNQLKNIQDGTLENLKKLKFVFIGDNPGGQALVQQVKKQLPQAEVHTTSMKRAALKKAAQFVGIALAIIAAVLAFLVIQHNRDIASNEATGPKVYAAAQEGTAALLWLQMQGGAPRNKLAVALIIAASQGDANTARTLLGGGARIEGPVPEIGRNAITPLAAAAAAGHEDVVRLLLSYGANIEQWSSANAAGVPTTGRPLDHAIAQEYVEVVRLLVEKKANVNHGRDFSNRETWYDATPLQLAREKGNQEIIDILTQAGAK